MTPTRIKQKTPCADREPERSAWEESQKTGGERKGDVGKPPLDALEIGEGEKRKGDKDQWASKQKLDRPHTKLTLKRLGKVPTSKNVCKRGTSTEKNPTSGWAHPGSYMGDTSRDSFGLCTVNKDIRKREGRGCCQVFFFNGRGGGGGGGGGCGGGRGGGGVGASVGVWHVLLAPVSLRARRKILRPIVSKQPPIPIIPKHQTPAATPISLVCASRPIAENHR